MKMGLSLALLAIVHATGAIAQNRATAPRFNTVHDREFDFWVGEWDVLLRTRQDDNTWKDSRSATAKIYRILDGKAILELWDENVEGVGIRGFSLRYFDAETQQWVLHLNWPGRNQSGMSSLRGAFRHGRGGSLPYLSNPLARTSPTMPAPMTATLRMTFSPASGLDAEPGLADTEGQSQG